MQDSAVQESRLNDVTFIRFTDKTRKLSYHSKDDRAMRPIYGCH